MSLLWMTATKRTIKGGPNGEKPSGAMVAIVPPADVAEALHHEDGESVENMHVTLVYLPYEENDPEWLEQLPTIVKHWASRQSPLSGKVGGVGTFNNPGSYVLWASVNIPGLEDLRHDLARHLEDCGYTIAKNHGWIPHLTLEYSETPFRFMPKVEEHKFPVDEVWACLGPKWQSFPLKEGK